VAFDIGGNSDMIEHQSNGYLAKPKSPEDLAKGIDWILNCEEYDTLKKNARSKVVESFGEQVVATEYLKLYKELT
jgi:glycosyltransferase involved in cell wall biosynthesis